MPKSPKRVIIAPLAWGLGHATRCIPIVHELLKLRCQVWAVLTAELQALYQPVFGKRIEYIPFDEVPVHYRQSFALAMLRQLPRFSAQMKRESSLADWLTEKLNPDLIISDNRYGFRSTMVKSVLITHQLQLRAGLLSIPANAVVHSLINRFDTVWVPDVASEPNLSGKLGHGKKLKLPVEYLGPLSRFGTAAHKKNPVYDWLAILSGPEPERSNFEDLLISSAHSLQLKLAIVAGQPEAENGEESHRDIARFSHLNDNELLKLIGSSRAIVCRSGYSTLCDLAAIGKKALLVPTPGQTEQNYLARHFARSFGFAVCKQNNRKGLLRALKTPEAYADGFEFEHPSNLGKFLLAALKN